jgi:uncharacterized membrane protein YhfC
LVTITAIMHFINILLMFLIPVGLGIFLAQRWRLGWRWWWIGAVTFVLSQLGHIPFNAGVTALFQQGILPAPHESWRFAFNVIFLGLSAGLWEEWARYGMYRWWAKDARTWRSGLVLGAGHGGIEAILTGVIAILTLYNMILASSMDITTLVPADQVALALSQIEGYWSAPWHLIMLGALERCFAIVFHLSASLLVMQAFTRRQLRWVWLAVAWHTALNSGAVVFFQLWGPYWAEVWLGLTTIASLGIIWKLRSPEIEEEALPAPALPPAMDEIPALPVIEPDESIENLENTRYN